MTAATSSCTSRHRRRRRTDLVIAVMALLLIAVAWILGAVRTESDLMPFVRQTIPRAEHIVKQDDGLYAAWADETESDLLGYVAIGTANGYGGPLQVAVAVDPSGEITGAVVASHKETSVWFTRVLKSGLVKSLTGKPYSDRFEIGTDLDGVTGATYTSKALAEAVLGGSRTVARRLGLPMDPDPRPEIIFGVPEAVVLALFAVGYLGHQRDFRFKRHARWVSLLVGMVVLGFIYNAPVTLAYITKLILGYWPPWQANLYWYFLMGGILFVFTVGAKNPYCQWFCPFGAAQECMGIIGAARPRNPRRYSELLKWLQRLLALAAIILGVFFRSPGLASYELFGTLFAMVGTSAQFAALGLVLIASLFILRPWCNYLCPIRPVVDLIRIIREQVKELWRKTTLKSKAA